MLSEFEGRVAVVTGAASGIGAALCRGFADLGMRVMCADISPEVEATAAALDGAAWQVVDVADEDSVQALADAAFADSGQVDLLCNNAGVFQAGVSWECSAEDWRWAFDVNVMGIIHGIRSFVPRMIEQGSPGHVVNTASVAAFVATGAVGPYTVSKCAAFSVTECLAHDLANAGSAIGASVLTPSSFDTGISRTAAVRPDRYPTEASPNTTDIQDALGGMTATGLAADAVVEPVVEAIRTDTFLIPTKPSYTAQIENRFTALTERRVPGPVIVD